MSSRMERFDDKYTIYIYLGTKGKPNYRLRMGQVACPCSLSLSLFFISQQHQLLALGVSTDAATATWCRDWFHWLDLVLQWPAGAQLVTTISTLPGPFGLT